MTKLAVLSDIRTNLPALEAVMEDLSQFSVNCVVVAGDVISFEPFTQQAVQRVIENNWAAIRWNGELFYWIMVHHECLKSGVTQLDFQFRLG
jgi:predicted phosphodiesterase